MPTQVTSIEKLKELASSRQFEGFIRLNGCLRSSKTMNYCPQDDSWDVFHGIDESWVEYSSTEALMEDYPILLEAIESGALFQD